MRSRVEIGMLAVVLAFGTQGICARQSAQDQSPQNQSPSQGQQPTEPAAPTPPDAAKPDSTPQTQAPNENQSAEPQAPPPAAPEAPVLKRRPAHKPIHKKTTTKPQSGKVVIRNGGAKEGSPQLAPGTSKEQQLHNRENTSQLLATTDANLKSVAARQLTPAQQSMMEQIRTYMTQSKAASASGDLDRAHTLAYKAHLLSNELAKK
jgi:outer membrane biosynthesis protein TonB